MPRTPMPHFVEPMLAILLREPFNDSAWLFETKLDGYRAIATIDENGNASLFSRKGLALDKDFPKCVRRAGSSQTAFDYFGRRDLRFG